MVTLRKAIAVLVICVAPVLMAADSGCGQKKARDPGAQTDPNPHQPHPSLPPKVKPTTKNKHCDVQFNFTWHGIHGGGVHGRYGVEGGETLFFHYDTNTGGFHKTLFNQPCRTASSEIAPNKEGLFKEPQGRTTCTIDNLTLGTHFEDIWENELAGAECRL